MIEQARQTCYAAGLDGGLLGIHPHNAMVSFRAGQPWAEVDYSLCRRTLWLIEQSYSPGRIVSRVLGRLWDRVER